MQNANYAKLTSMHFMLGNLKTGMYYLRTKAAVDAIKFTLNNDKKEPIEVKSKAATTVAAVEAVEPVAINGEEYRAMLELAKNAGPDDCEMCGFNYKIEERINSYHFGSCFFFELFPLSIISHS
jgi:ribonucleoside-diphosphate reductase alpha chain